MVATARSEQAALPTISRPQSIIGLRSRVTHLPRHARLADDAARTILPDSTGQGDSVIFGVSQGLSYRNAAFHILLSTPIFFNFLRAHWHRVGDKKSKCQIQKCLTCRLALVAAYYWGAANVKQEERNAHLAEQISELWTACLELFWGPNARTSQKVGPANENDESYTESFLLHLLLTIQRQLEASPAEHQTFLRMFTTHIKRFRKCSNPACRWTSSSFQWEQSLFLPISVQKPVGKHSHTDILAGIKLALDQESKGLSMRRSSMNAILKCATCSAPTALAAEIVNYPEVLILVRNLDRLASDDQPDIPIKTSLDMKSLGSNEVKYELITGAVEYKVSPTIARAAVFARGMREATWNKWLFLNHDGTIEDMHVSQLDQLQRLHTVVTKDHQQTRSGFIFPEIFVFGRGDAAGIKQQDLERMQFLLKYGQASPAPLESLARESELISRSVTDMFTQRIGNGLLKFKINLTPADPEPHDSIPFTLDIGYERNGCFWIPEKRIRSRLIPLTQCESEAHVSPKEKEPYNRFYKREKGVSTPTEPSSAQIRLLESADGVKPFPLESGFPEVGPPNPFSAAGAKDVNVNVDGMELDVVRKFNFAQNPTIEKHKQAIDKRAAATYYNSFKTNNRGGNFQTRNQNNTDRKRQRREENFDGGNGQQNNRNSNNGYNNRGKNSSGNRGGNRGGHRGGNRNNNNSNRGNRS